MVLCLARLALYRASHGTSCCSLYGTPQRASHCTLPAWHGASQNAVYMFIGTLRVASYGNLYCSL